jgi:hypothetical protein
MRMMLDSLELSMSCHIYRLPLEFHRARLLIAEEDHGVARFSSISQLFACNFGVL